MCLFQDARTWKAEQTNNPAIDRRVGHSAVYDEKKNVIYVYGGSKHKKWYNDVYMLDVTTWKWEKCEVWCCCADILFI